MEEEDVISILKFDDEKGEIVLGNEAYKIKLQNVSLKNLDSETLANNSVTNAKIASESIDARVIGENQIVESKLAANSVTNVKIASESIDARVIGENQIVESKLAANSVTNVKIASGSIDARVIGENQIVESKLAANSVTNVKLASESIDARVIGENQVSRSKLETALIQQLASISQPNTIINGDFDTWQRGTSFSAINNAYHADRFAFSKNGTMEYTLSRSTDVPTQLESGLQSNHSLLATCITQQASMGAADFAKITYSVEGYDFKKFHGNTATLSFWVKGTKTGIYTVGFANADVSRVQPVEYTIHASDTWEKKTITLTFNGGGAWNFTNGQGLDLSFALSAGTNHHGVSGAWETSNRFATANQINAADSTSNHFRLAQVKLELGSVATPFKERPMAEELALCQRYYQKSYDSDVFAGTSTEDGAVRGWTQAGAVSGGMTTLPTEMRVWPMATIYDLIGNSNKISVMNWTGALTHNIGINRAFSTTKMVAARCAGIANVYEVNFHYTMEAEL